MAEGSTAKARHRAGIARAIDEKIGLEQERDEQERAIDRAASRSIEWARRQYILRMPGDLNTKHNLIHGADHD